MKIEIGENLIASYLRRVEDCRIVQTNWKKSSQWKITEYEEKRSRELFDKVKSSLLFKDVFKKNSYEQLMKQLEIDVIGINTVEKSVFGIDIAFHTAGLEYKNNVENVMMKIFRTIIALQATFGDFDKINAYFATPFVNKKDEKMIREFIEEANKLIDDEMISVNFICNESFFDSIVDPTINNIEDDNDTSELFLRSIKLIQLDKRVLPSTDNVKDHKLKATKNPVTITEKTSIDGMKIGQFVQNNMRKLYEQNIVSKDEINNLQNKEYSKKTFDQNYEILRSSDKDITGKDGRNRYYANKKFFGEYYLNSQWVERHWKPFLDWLEKMNKKNLTAYKA